MALSLAKGPGMKHRPCSWLCSAPLSPVLRPQLMRLLCLSRSNFKLVAVTSKLYAIGGQAVSNVECYSPEQDAWSFVAPLPTPLAEFSACECQGKIYVMGGYTTRGEQVSWGVMVGGPHSEELSDAPFALSHLPECKGGVLVPGCC